MADILLRTVKMDDGTTWRFACTDDNANPFAIKIGPDPIHPMSAADIQRLRATAILMEKLLERKQAFES